MKFCSYCNCHITNMTSHQRSKKHISNVENGENTKENITVSMKGPTLNMDKLLEQATEEDNSDSDSVEESVANYSIYSENFIQELENDKFETTEEPSHDISKKIKQMRHENALKTEELRQRKLEEVERKKFLKSAVKEEEEVEIETEILGKEKRVILKKIQLFKNCFKQELKNTKFKISKTASVQELEQILDEMQTIVSVNSVEDFCMDIIYNSLKIVECASSMTRDFDITGLSESLKSNEQFVKLCKLMFIKYQTFDAIPIEYQLLFIVIVNGVIVAQVNKAKKTHSQV